MKLAEFPLVPRSFAAALLAAFALALVPLCIALAIAVTQAHRLAARGEASIARAAELGEQSRALSEAVLAMERSVRQAGVLGAPEVIEAYAAQRARLQRAAEVLAVDVDAARAVRELGAREDAVYAALRTEGASAALAHWPAFGQAADALLAEVDAALARERAALAARPAEVARAVVWTAAAALPLALALAALFAWRLGRPVRSLGAAIRRLGEGDWSVPVAVRGPRDIASLGPQLDWLRQRLIDLQAARRTLLQSVSHDLKTPLAAISEGRALLADELVGPVTPDQRAVLELIGQNAERLLARIDALVEAGVPGGSARVPLDAVVDGVLAEHALACAARGLRVRATLERDPARTAVQGDPEQLRMIVDNLVSNALKYSPDGGAVSVTLRAGEGGPELAVRDQGPGVAPQEARRIFAPNARGSAALQMRAPGSGMGLTLARALAERHGGSLRLAQDEASGACFVLCLPQAGGAAA